MELLHQEPNCLALAGSSGEVVILSGNKPERAKQRPQQAGSLLLTMGFHPLNVVRPFLAVLPDVPQADRRVPFKERFLYTAVTLFIFLVCSQLPLYGIKTNSATDPFYWARVIMASNRGTCMELGISPIMKSEAQVPSIILKCLVPSMCLE
jgi:hypothetical protein